MRTVPLVLSQICVVSSSRVPVRLFIFILATPISVANVISRFLHQNIMNLTRSSLAEIAEIELNYHFDDGNDREWMAFLFFLIGPKIMTSIDIRDLNKKGM